jgi:hypothetical protein
MLFDSLVKLLTQSQLAQEHEAACDNAICAKEGGDYIARGLLKFERVDFKNQIAALAWL